jgi:DNA-directed RNA polymerase subunit RPC12/RpoP
MGDPKVVGMTRHQAIIYCNIGSVEDETSSWVCKKCRNSLYFINDYVGEPDEAVCPYCGSLVKNPSYR